jgi:hypothetical protein
MSEFCGRRTIVTWLCEECGLSQCRACRLIGIRALEWLETATGDHWRTTAAKNVFRSHKPVVNARDLVAHAFREY